MKQPDDGKLDLNLRCRQCKVFAYCDLFEGEYSEDGYLCSGCIRLLNLEAVHAEKTRQETAKTEILKP